MTHEQAMENWLASGPSRSKPRRSWAPVVTGLLVGALLGTATTVVTTRSPAPAEPASLAREWQSRALPNEWRWERQSVQYEHMFPKLR